jgi:hypothetical protein
MKTVASKLKATTWWQLDTIAVPLGLLFGNENLRN